MEKPDFFKMAIDRNLYLAAPEVAEMCEIVWNTHVVPLQEKIAGFDSLLDTLNDQAKREFKKLESENKALREEIDSLKDQILENSIWITNVLRLDLI